MGRHSRVPLSRERIVAATLDLIDREGLVGVTMARVGAELAVSDMALYKHYPSKEAMLADALDALLASTPAPPNEGSWRQRLTALYGGLWGLLRAHPNIMPLLCSLQLTSPEIREHDADGQAILAAAGLDEEAAREALVTLTAYALGFALLVVGGYEDMAATRESAAAAPAAAPAGAHIDWDEAERRFYRGLDSILAAIA